MCVTKFVQQVNFVDEDIFFLQTSQLFTFVIFYHLVFFCWSTFKWKVSFCVCFSFSLYLLKIYANFELHSSVTFYLSFF